MTEEEGTAHRDLEERLSVKAREDEVFKQELLSNPQALPARLSEAELSDELSDEELEAVTGGVTCHGGGWDPLPTKPPQPPQPW